MSFSYLFIAGTRIGVPNHFKWVLEIFWKFLYGGMKILAVNWSSHRTAFYLIPLIGDVNVDNMSVAEIRNVITKKLTEYIPDASVAVMVKQINSLKAYVIGQVNNPGVFDITLETRVMQVLAMAQGLTPFAAERDIHILRYKKKTVQKIGFDYKEVLKGNNLESGYIDQARVMLSLCHNFRLIDKGLSNRPSAM